MRNHAWHSEGWVVSHRKHAGVSVGRFASARLLLAAILLLALGSQATGGEAPKSVATFERWEAVVPMSLGGADPNDPEQVSVVGVFEHEAGKRFRVPGFGFRDYRYAIDPATREERLTAAGESELRVRFAPPLPGRYTWRIEVALHGEPKPEQSGQFVATPPTGKGPLRRAEGRRYLQTASGEGVFLIGQNVAWSTEAAPLDDLLRYVREMAASGQNCLRLWHCTWCLGFEHEETGRYDLERAWKLDRLLEECERRGVYVVLCLDNAHDIKDRKSPYWKGLGRERPGITKPTEFFTSEHARRAFRNRIRYAVARWGYSSAIAAWELCNEIEYAVLGPLELNSEVRDRYFRPWLDEMAAHTRKWDAHGHLITASLAVDRLWDGLYRMPWLDVAQHHCYLNSWDTDSAAKVLRNLGYIADAGKPYLLGEFGGAEAGVYGAKENVVNKTDERGVHLHNALWASALSGACGTPLNWWWDSYIRANQLYGHYAALAAFLRGTPWLDPKLRPVDLSTDAARILALRGDDWALAWAQHRQFTWENAKALDRLEPTPSLPLRLDKMTPGSYRVEWWDTHKGVVTRAEERVCAGDLSLEIPPIRSDMAVKARRVLSADPGRERTR